MANVFTIYIKPEGKKTYKLYKNFDATTNTEERIASALYDSYVRIKGKGTALITKYYADGYSFWDINNDEYVCKVTNYNYSEVKNINSTLIGKLYDSYRLGTQKPLKIKEAYTFLKEKRGENLKIVDLQKSFYYDYKIFGGFISNVLAFPQKYNKKVYNICKIVYSNTQSLYSTPITEDMILYPDWLQPKGFVCERLNFNTWKMSAELDNQIINTTVVYDTKGISKYGAVGQIELAGKLVEKYILDLLEDAYKQYTENNMDYKINQVVRQLNRYIDYVRGEDFRANYDKTGGHMKKPYEFMIDMTDLLKSFSDNRFEKKDIYDVINYFKNNPTIFKQYYAQSNIYMDLFYPWFEGRITRGKKLFKNVPN